MDRVILNRDVHYSKTLARTRKIVTSVLFHPQGDTAGYLGTHHSTDQASAYRCICVSVWVNGIAEVKAILNDFPASSVTSLSLS